MRKYLIFIMALLIIVLSGCENKADDTSDNSSESNTSETQSNEIIFNEDSIDASGLEINDNVVTISSGGTYTLSGTSSDAQVVINAPGEDITLVFNNLNLANTTTAPINGIDANSVTIELAENSSNTISDSTTNKLESALLVDEIILNITGSGELNVNANYGDGIESNSEIFIADGIININAVDDGINGGDGLTIDGGTIYINSEGDGLDSNDYLTINGGNMYVSAGNNANGPVDFLEGTSFSLTGGNLYAFGGQMSALPTEVSTPYVAANQSGTSFTLNGYDIKDYSSLLIATEDMVDGEEYTIDEIGSFTPTTEAATGDTMMGGQMPNGEMPNGEQPQ